MSGQVSRGSAGEYQADERAGVARLRWRVSGICTLTHALEMMRLSEREELLAASYLRQSQTTGKRGPVGQVIKRIYNCSCALDQRAVLFWLVI